MNAFRTWGTVVGLCILAGCTAIMDSETVNVASSPTPILPPTGQIQSAETLPQLRDLYSFERAQMLSISLNADSLDVPSQGLLAQSDAHLRFADEQIEGNTATAIDSLRIAFAMRFSAGSGISHGEAAADREAQAIVNALATAAERVSDGAACYTREGALAQLSVAEAQAGLRIDIPEQASRVEPGDPDSYLLLGIEYGRLHRRIATAEYWLQESIGQPCVEFDADAIRELYHEVSALTSNMTPTSWFEHLAFRVFPSAATIANERAWNGAVLEATLAADLYANGLIQTTTRRPATDNLPDWSTVDQATATEAARILAFDPEAFVAAADQSEYLSIVSYHDEIRQRITAVK